LQSHVLPERIVQSILRVEVLLLRPFRLNTANNSEL
jgi:hypothetical protein